VSRMPSELLQRIHASTLPTQQACGHRRFARNATAEKFLLGAECAGVIAAVGPGVTLKVTLTPAQEQTPLLSRKRAVQTSIFLHGMPPVLTLTMHADTQPVNTGRSETGRWFNLIHCKWLAALLLCNTGAQQQGWGAGGTGRHGQRGPTGRRRLWCAPAYPRGAWADCS